MTRIARSLVVLVMLGLLAGCGGSSSTTAPNPPSGPSETESNDFTPQNLGTLSTSDLVLSCSAANSADVDLYRVTLTGTTNLFVKVDWAGATDLELSISNSSGIFVRTVDTAGHPEQCTLAALPAGTYTVRVGSFTNSATNYTLTIGPR